jgi:uncharacterized protein
VGSKLVDEKNRRGNEEAQMFSARSWFPILLVIAVISASAHAQQPDDNIPTKAEILNLLDLMQTRAQMTRSLEGVEKQMQLGAEQGFKTKVPDASPEQLAKVDKLFAGIFQDMPIDELMDAIVPIYQKHLTKTDVAAMVAFYSSPAGQKILKEMPAISAEAMQAGGEVGRRVFAAKSAEFDRRLADLTEDSKKKADPPDPPK